MGSEITLPIIVKLDYPVEHGSETISELRAERRLQTGDLRGLKTQEMTIDDQYTVAARWLGVPTSVIHKLDMVDWARVTRAMNPFFSAFQEIGSQESD